MTRKFPVVSVVGTRPNFMKIAPVARRLAGHAEIESVLIHTRRHYDVAMSHIFRELGLPEPDMYLGIGSGTRTAQTTRALERLEPAVRDSAADLGPVRGHVNSTLSAAVTAAQLGLPVGHVEAGLRSFGRTMPDELNRILTDQLSGLLFIHSPEARAHLLAEGRPERAIYDVG